MTSGDLQPGDVVTLAWYTPGEADRPRGIIVPPGPDDLARVAGDDRTDRVLVHWHTGNWCRWEQVVDLVRDEEP